MLKTYKEMKKSYVIQDSQPAFDLFVKKQTGLNLDNHLNMVKTVAWIL